MTNEDYKPEFGTAAVHLLRGILYRDQEAAWAALIRYRGRLEEYFAILGLRLLVDEAEGYAYLRQYQAAESEEAGLPEDFPSLMSRRRLSYSLTLLLVLLRKRLLEFEMAGNDTRLVLSQRDMVEMMRIYEDSLQTNERKREDLILKHIKRLADYGFLQPMKAEEDRYEVNRIIKAYLPIDELKKVADKLRAYAENKGK
jgi:hypothetical protein